MRQGTRELTLRSATGEERWSLSGPAQELASPYTASYWVRDRHPDLEGRAMLLVCLDESRLDERAKRWDVPILRQGFARSVEMLCAARGVLPEPVDYFELAAAAGPAGPGPGPAVVLAPQSGKPLFIPRGAPEARDRVLRGVCLDLCYGLRDLHGKGFVLEQLPPRSLRRLAATGKAIPTGFLTLARMEGYRGFSRHEPGLAPSEEWAAPECFAESGHLTPATDVWALGRALLALLGARLAPRAPTQEEVSEAVSSLGLSSLWGRFFKLALMPRQSERFDDCRAVIAFLMSDGKQDARAAPPPKGRADSRPRAVLVLCPDTPPGPCARVDYAKVIAELQPLYDLADKVALVHPRRGGVHGLARLFAKLGVRVLGEHERVEPGAALGPALLEASAVAIVGACDAPLVKSILELPAVGSRRRHIVPLRGVPPEGWEVIDPATVALGGKP